MKENKMTINFNQIVRDIHWSYLTKEAIGMGRNFVLLFFPLGKECIQIFPDRILTWSDKDGETREVCTRDDACKLISRWCDYWGVAFEDLAEKLIKALRDK